MTILGAGLYPDLGSGHSSVMAILKIARMGHPVLAKAAAPVEDPGAPEIRILVQDMLDTLEDSGGTGLAAPQVHASLRIIVFFVDLDRAVREDGHGEGLQDEAVPLTVLINPDFTPLSETKTLGWEACLSVPDLAGLVPRYDAISYRGLDLEGNVIEREARGFHARVVQHEMDHLDGRLYPLRMTDLSQLIYASEMRYHGSAAWRKA